MWESREGTGQDLPLPPAGKRPVSLPPQSWFESRPESIDRSAANPQGVRVFRVFGPPYNFLATNPREPDESNHLSAHSVVLPRGDRINSSPNRFRTLRRVFRKPTDQLPRERWPHIGPEELRELWERYAPPFLRLDNTERDLPELREVFLSWLETTGVDLGSPEPSELFYARPRRLRLESVRLVKRGLEAETAIALSLNGRQAEVRRSGPGISAEILRISAETTLEASHQLVPGVSFGLDRAFVIDQPISPPRSIAVVVVRNSLSRPAEQLIGAADLSVSEPEAAAKATLDAINRRVERETVRREA